LSYTQKKWSNNKSVGLIVCCVLLFAAAGCKSVSIPLVRSEADYENLPVESVSKAADFIEEQVREGNRTPELMDEPDLVIDTPEIKQALRSRAARAYLIEELLDSGHMLEQSDGKIAILRTAAYKASGSKRDKDRHAMIIISENRDRVIVYDSIRRSNDMSSAARSAIEEIFFSARKAYLSPGHKFRIDGGEVQVN